MRKMIMDFAPLQWCRQTTASPAHLSKNHTISSPRYDGHRHRTTLCATMAACLLTQIFSFASLANAYEEFGLIEGATPACKDCAQNNNAPTFGQTRVAMQDAYGQAPAMVGSDPVAEAPPAVEQSAIEPSAPVAVESVPQPQAALQDVQQQPFSDQPFVNQENFAGQPGYTDQPFVESQYPQSGGLGASAVEYPAESFPLEQSWPSEYPASADYSMNYGQEYGFDYGMDYGMDYGQTGFEQVGYEQDYYPGVDQVSYQGEYPSQDFGQSYVSEMPVDQYSSDPTYASSGAMPTVTQQQNYNSTYTSSASSSGQVQPGLAQQKADQAAQSGVRGHLGGGLGGAKYEGVGWSNHSAQNAINSCCYWGMRPTAQIGVSKGNDGFWYACVLYY